MKSLLEGLIKYVKNSVIYQPSRKFTRNKELSSFGLQQGIETHIFFTSWPPPAKNIVRSHSSMMVMVCGVIETLGLSNSLLTTSKISLHPKAVTAVVSHGTWKGKYQMNITDTSSIHSKPMKLKKRYSPCIPKKSLGPDGMNPAFFQNYWEIVGRDITDDCLKYLENAEILESLNTTQIVLIPKKTKPEPETHITL